MDAKRVCGHIDEVMRYCQSHADGVAASLEKSNLALATDLLNTIKASGDSKIKSCALNYRDPIRTQLYDALKNIFFFASVIKCGEPWTDECQKALEEVRAAREAYENNNC